MSVVIRLGEEISTRICLACRLSICRKGDARCGLVKEQRRRNRGTRLYHRERYQRLKGDRRPYRQTVVKRKKVGLTKSDLQRIEAFLREQYGAVSAADKKDWWEAYQSWSLGGKAWNEYELGGSYIHTALWWYQYRFHPGSKEWRPSVIICALREQSLPEAERDERLPVNWALKYSTKAEKRKARKIFTKVHGLLAYSREIKPYLKRGVMSFFHDRPTGYTRDYVDILAGVVGTRNGEGCQ